jgi:hypothetical protein
MFFYQFAENFIFGEFPEEFYTCLAGLATLRLAKLAERHRLYLLYGLIEFLLLRSDAGEMRLGEKLAVDTRSVHACSCNFMNAPGGICRTGCGELHHTKLPLSTCRWPSALRIYRVQYGSRLSPG